MGRPLDLISWPKEKLADRFEELEGLLEFTKYEPRKQCLSRELMLIAFELVSRKKEAEDGIHTSA